MEEEKKCECGAELCEDCKCSCDEEVCKKCCKCDEGCDCECKKEQIYIPLQLGLTIVATVRGIMSLAYY